MRFHADARYDFATMLELQTFRWGRGHFRLGVDPHRVATAPSTLDVRTGLVALLVGSRRDLETENVYSTVEAADGLRILPASFKVKLRVWTR